MKSVSKYLLTLFAIVNIMAVNRLINYKTDILLNITLCLGIITIISNISKLISSQYISKYKFFYIFIFVMWAYQLTFGWAHTSPKTYSYLFAKTIILLMIVALINKYPAYYLNKFYLLICIITSFLVIWGAILSPWSTTDRAYFGFGNPNALAGLSAICFVYLINNITLPQLIRYAFLIILIFAVLMSGSRSSLGTIVIAIVWKYRFSFKLLSISAIIATTIFFILPQYNIHILGIDRFVNTIESQDLSKGREIERRATILMINNSPIEGNGIYCEQSEEAKQISELGSHNGYLDILKWFGLPFGVFMIIALVLCSFNLIKTFWRTTNAEFQAHQIIIIGVLSMSFFEGLILGVNNIINTLFFISLGVLDNYKYHNSNFRLLSPK